MTGFLGFKDEKFMAGQPTPNVPPPRNKGLIAGLLKGNQVRLGGGQADVVAAPLPVMPPWPDVDARQYAARARESAANRRAGNDGSGVHILKVC